MSDEVIGFSLGHGECIDCGKRITYNTIRPEVRCFECRTLIPLLRKKKREDDNGKK